MLAASIKRKYQILQTVSLRNSCNKITSSNVLHIILTSQFIIPTIRRVFHKNLRNYIAVSKQKVNSRLQIHNVDSKQECVRRKKTNIHFLCQLCTPL